VRAPLLPHDAGLLLIDMLVAVMLAIGGCSRTSTEAPAVVRPHIILITIDALRADHLGVYGYDRPTSPAIDAFASDAVVVSEAIAQAPYTKASMGSLFSGLFPTTHKAHSTSPSFHQVMTGRAGTPALPATDILPNEIETLAEVLQAAGYATIGFSTNPHLISEFGFAQGFERFKFFAGGTFAPAAEVVRETIAAVDARDSRPLFVWLHMMEVHSPYQPPEQYRTLFPPRTPPEPIDPAVIPPWIRVGDSTDLHLYEALYDADVRTADAAVGDLLAGVRSRGLWDRAVIVLTADHGEEFMEHGGMEHNRTLYDEMLRVPLIVRLPGRAPARVEAQVQLVDLFPTLAGLAGAQVPPGLHGADVLPVLEGRARGDTYAYAEIVGQRYALRGGRYKLISSLSGRPELFDLKVDPKERQNLADRDAPRAAEMERRLRRIVDRAVEDGQRIRARLAPVEPGIYERLKALGYVQ
jgi:arylsulfatase